VPVVDYLCLERVAEAERVKNGVQLTAIHVLDIPRHVLDEQMSPVRVEQDKGSAAAAAARLGELREWWVLSRTKHHHHHQQQGWAS